jgi:glutamate transport system substrate-binding protein
MKGNVMKAFLTRRKSFVVAASAALALTLSACGGGGGTTSNPSVAEKPTFAAGSTMEKLSKAGSIKIGTKFDQPLFGQVGLDGKPIGFDVEMGKLIAAKLGIPADKIEWSETVSANREPFIEQGKVDLVIATYTINDKRKQVVSFAGPYYEAGQALMVNKDNDTIKKPEDVKGKKVCSVTGSTPAATIVEKYGAELVPAATYSACLEPLRNKQVEAITTDNVILAGFVDKEPEAFKLASDETFTKEPYGIGLKKDDTVFRNWINDQLEEFSKDGSYKKAWEATAGSVIKTAPELPAIDRY